MSGERIGIHQERCPASRPGVANALGTIDSSHADRYLRHARATYRIGALVAVGEVLATLSFWAKPQGVARIPLPQGFAEHTRADDQPTLSVGT